MFAQASDTVSPVAAVLDPFLIMQPLNFIHP